VVEFYDTQSEGEEFANIEVAVSKVDQGLSHLEVSI
jgi:hypothetical protein